MINDQCPLCPTCLMNETFTDNLCDCIGENKKQSLLCVCSLCGCGSEQVPDLLYEVLKWCCTENTASNREIEPFLKRGCYCSPAHELAAKVLDKADLVTHGTGIGWPSATEKGRQLIDWIDRE